MKPELFYTGDMHVEADEFFDGEFKVYIGDSPFGAGTDYIVLNREQLAGLLVHIGQRAADIDRPAAEAEDRERDAVDKRAALIRTYVFQIATLQGKLSKLLAS